MLRPVPFGTFVCFFLSHIEILVEAVCPHELSVGSGLLYFAVFHDDDEVGVLDCGKPVGNYDCCSALHQSP